MNTLVVVTGPTASGKTGLAVNLAVAIGCEIISADSRQFYKGMEIGTAAPSKEQLSMVKHHFTAFLEPGEYYSASMFEHDVTELLNDIFRRKKVALMAGGSGLYINAVCDGIDEIPDIDPGIREIYLRRFEEGGIESLRAELRKVDPDHYSRVDLRNPRRIMRALEVFATTGRTYSSFLTGRKQDRGFTTIMTGIMPPREELYARINQRVDDMMAAGLEEEAARLLPLRNTNALQTVGYRELFDYFDGKIAKEEAVELIKRNTRRYARRQITWWSRRNDIRWFESCDTEGVIRHLSSVADIEIQG